MGISQHNNNKCKVVLCLFCELKVYISLYHVPPSNGQFKKSTLPVTLHIGWGRPHLPRIVCLIIICGQWQRKAPVSLYIRRITNLQL